MNQAFRDSLAAVTDRLEAEKDTIRGVIITSAKKTFFAGGDLRDLIRVTPETAQELFDGGLAIKRNLRRIETLGKPVVAAINGAALGGGYEIALACHHRVALDAPGSKIGCPEVTLGLLPGGGGVVRTVRLLGIADALLKVLLQGTQYSPRRALENGLVDEVAATQEELLAKARAFIDANPESQQPWDKPGYRIPGGTPANPKFAANLPAFPATLRKQTNGAPYPAPRNILAAAVEGAQVDFETAQVIEARYFVELAAGQTSKNMIQAFFFDLQAVNSGANRPKGVEPRQVRKVAVLGAGMMGAGIAYSCARAGIDVVLKDVSPEAAAKGKAYSEKLCAKAVSRGRTTQEKARRAARPHHAHRRPGRTSRAATPSSRPSSRTPRSSTRCSRRSSTSSSRTRCSAPTPPPCPSPPSPRASSARPTSSACTSSRPSTRCRSSRSSRASGPGDEALARAFDLVRQIKKTPIVVNDSRGFFTSRVIGHFINEGVAMVGEGIEPASVEQAAAQAGYPAKVLSLMDELTLTLPRKIRDESRSGPWRRRAAPGPPTPPRPSSTAWSTSSAAPGRSGGAGFYDYGDDGRRAGLWPGLREHFTTRGCRDPLRGHAGTHALLRGPGHRPAPGGGRPDLRRRRQHRLHLRHRLPRLDRWRPAVHQRLRGRPARASWPARVSWPTATASGSPRRRCWWRRRRRGSGSRDA